MKTLHCFLLFFSLFGIVNLASNDLKPPPLRCYQCNSTESWSSCERNVVEVSCYGGNGRCVKRSIKDSTYGAFYLKGCAKSCKRSFIDDCEDTDVDCEVYCCVGNYCNAGSLSPSKIPFTLLVTVGAGVMIYNQ